LIASLVVEFAKKSGDLASLSKTDLKLIALTHMMHIELNGSANVTQLGDIRRINTTTTQEKHSSSSSSNGLSTTIAAVTTIHTSTDVAAVAKSTSSVTAARADKGSWASIVTSMTSNQVIDVAVGTTIAGDSSSNQEYNNIVVNKGPIIEDDDEDDAIVGHDGGDGDQEDHEDDDSEENDDDDGDDDDDDYSNDEADSDDDSNINIDDGTTHLDIVDLLDINCDQSSHVSSMAHNTDDLATTTQDLQLSLSMTDNNFPILPTYASPTGGALHELSHIIDRNKKKLTSLNNFADDWSDVPIESSYVTSFEHNCSCSLTEDHHHHHTSHAANHTTTSILALSPTVQLTNGFQSRVIRPSGLSSGNAFTSAAENKKMHLEDDGKGWINDDNLIKFKGNASNLIYSRQQQKQQQQLSGQQQQRDLHRVKKINSSSPNDNIETNNDAGNGDGKERKDSNNNQNEDNADADAVGIGEVIKKKKIKKKLKNAKRKAAICKYKIACLTTDFTMQNVLLQMNLSVLSVDGLLVTTIRQWVLRCMSCYTVHYEMDRMFCRKCGGCHLSRVSASIDQGGKLQLHLKKNYRIDLRGSKYSLPGSGDELL
jgi:rRNA maturation endonuclease Nob1